MSSNRPQQPTWRRILPRTEQLRTLPSPSRSGHVNPVACENCRRTKQRCNGARPTCQACIRRDLHCSYRAEAGESSTASLQRRNAEAQRELQNLRKSHATLRRIVSAIQTKEDVEVSTIVRYLRDSQDPEAVAKQIEGGDLLLQLHLYPETKYRFTFPYLSRMPEKLFTPDNPYMDSLLAKSTLLLPESSATIPTLIEARQPQYFMPYSVARIADSRIYKMDFTRWTVVSTNNALMRDLLHKYLLSDYQFITLFHKDYFLDDMLSGSTRFCSSLLVNAILAHACCCHESLPHRTEHWNSASLGYKFLAEARRLWDFTQMEPNSVTTVQAGMVLNIIYNIHSMDKIGITYGAQAASIAYEIGLFKPAIELMDSALQTVRDFTAWCLFYSLSMQCYVLMLPSPVPAKPAMDLPDPNTNPNWYGEILVQYPSNQNIVPLHYPQWTKFKFEMICFLRPVAAELWEKEVKLGQASRQELFVSAFCGLTDLYSTLPTQLSPKKDRCTASHCTTVCGFNTIYTLTHRLPSSSLWYHNIMITLCPLIVAESSDKGSSESLSTVSEQLLLSKICFETLHRLYYLRNGYEGGHIIILQSLGVFSFMALRDVESCASSTSQSSIEESTRSTLILAAKGLYEQGKNYFLAASIFHILRSQMTEADQAILAHYRSTGKEDFALQEARTQHVKAQYPLNIVSMTNDPESQRMDNVLRQYEELAMQQIGSA